MSNQYYWFFYDFIDFNVKLYYFINPGKMLVSEEDSLKLLRNVKSHIESRS